MTNQACVIIEEELEVQLRSGGTCRIAAGIWQGTVDRVPLHLPLVPGNDGLPSVVVVRAVLEGPGERICYDGLLTTMDLAPEAGQACQQVVLGNNPPIDAVDFSPDDRTERAITVDGNPVIMGGKLMSGWLQYQPHPDGLDCRVSTFDPKIAGRHTIAYRLPWQRLLFLPAPVFYQSDGMIEDVLLHGDEGVDLRIEAQGT